MFELPPVMYDLLQRAVNGNYESLGNLIQQYYSRHSDRPALELGSGTGTLSRFFDSGRYVGVEIDPKRVEAARRNHPRHEFIAADATNLAPSFLSRFGFIFCRAWLHHVDDEAAKRTLERIRSAVALAHRDVEFLVAEPLPPVSPWREPVSFILEKLDRGHNLRSLPALREMFGPDISDLAIGRGPWYWPVAGTTFVVKFAPAIGDGSAPARSASVEVESRTAASSHT